MSDLEIFIFAGIALFFAYKIWTVLGKTNGDEKARANGKIIDANAYAEKLRTAAQTNKDDSKTVILNPAQKDDVQEEIPANLKTSVDDAKKIDPSFTLKKFKDGAVQAFELVIESFSKKKRDALQFLLSDDVYANFNNEIEKRDAQGLDASTTVVALDNAEILEVEVKDNICHIVVKFVSEQIHFIKNKAGEIIEGSKSQIDRVTDIWTFERNLTSKKPNWTVVGIQSA